MQSILSICSLTMASICNKTISRPMISVNSHGIKGTWLFDTGAQASVMSVKMFRQIPPDKRPKKLPQMGQLSAANQSPLKVIGVYDMTLQIMGISCNNPVYVVDGLNQNAILGTDVMHKLNLCYSPKSNDFFFETNYPRFETAQISTISTETLPALTTLPIKVTGLTPGCQRPPKGILSLASISAPNYPLIGGGQGLVTPNQLGEVTVLVQNCAPYDIQLQRGEVLGYIENIQEVSGRITPVSYTHLTLPTKA